MSGRKHHYITGWRFRTTAFAVAVVLAAVNAKCPAQDPSLLPSAFGARYDGFQALFSFANLKPGTIEEFQQGRPNEWLVVVLGDPARLAELGDLRRAVNQGCSLLVATDRRVHRGPLVWSLGLTIESGPVLASTKEEGFNEFPDCPLIARWESESPLRVGVERIALNNAGYLGGRNADHWALGRFSEGVTVNGNDLDPAPAAVAAANLGDGRLLVISDQSLFINEMIVDGANNLTFARNTVEWLINGRDREELKVLLLVDGNEVDRLLDPRFESGQWPSELELLLALVNEGVAELQRENLINRALIAGEESIPPALVRSLMLLAPAAMLAVALLLWLFASRRRTPVASKKVSGPPPLRATVFQQRWTELSKLGNFVEPARRLALRVLARTELPAGWDDRMPRFIVNLPGWWQRMQTRQRLRWYWRLAAGKPVGRVRLKDFRAGVDTARQFADWIDRGIIAVQWSATRKTHS